MTDKKKITVFELLEAALDEDGCLSAKQDPVSLQRIWDRIYDPENGFLLPNDPNSQQSADAEFIMIKRDFPKWKGPT